MDGRWRANRTYKRTAVDVQISSENSYVGVWHGIEPLQSVYTSSKFRFPCVTVDGWMDG